MTKIIVKLRPQNGIKVWTNTSYLFDAEIGNQVKFASDWAIKTDGIVNDGGDQDYSSKAYAIGGTGNLTNNSKYFSEQSSSSATRSQTWAEGNDSAIEALGGTHSSLTSAGLAYAYANAGEDIPVEMFLASHQLIVQGQKGDKGDKGDTGATGVTGQNGTNGLDGLTTQITLNNTTYTQTNGNITLPDLQGKRTLITDMTSTSMTLSNANANTDYQFGTLTAFTISAVDTSYNETNIWFTAGTGLSSITIPSTLKPLNHFSPTEGKLVCLSILNNTIVYGSEV